MESPLKRRRHGGFVAYTLTERERARLSRLAERLGFAHLDPLAADIFRVGLATLEGAYAPAGRLEQFQALRARVRRVARG